ncbi:MAG: ABC transporter ATP-binding protein [Firmicutes bacterium]|nr:ABC transporter ATP-binding protein [Bacillota bacterium]
MSAALVLDQVTKVYGEGRTAVRAVDQVSLSVERGEVVLVMGPSGSGKTTLLSMSGCLLRPSSGRIWLNGQEVTGLGEGELPEVRLRNIGFIFQSFNLLAALTALENVELVMRLAGTGGRAARETAAELLTSLGLGNRLHHLPADLSGGEKQRVAIARAFANTPSLVLADEPTANLDSQSGMSVSRLLCEAACEAGKAVVIVSHDARIKAIATRTAWLEDGILSLIPRGQGDPAEAMESR